MWFFFVARWWIEFWVACGLISFCWRLTATDVIVWHGAFASEFTHTWICICVYMYIYIYVHTYVYIYMYIYIYIPVYVYLLYIHIYVYTYVYTYIYMYVYNYVYVYIFMNMCMNMMKTKVIPGGIWSAEFLLPWQTCLGHPTRTLVSQWAKKPFCSRAKPTLRFRLGLGNLYMTALLDLQVFMNCPRYVFFTLFLPLPFFSHTHARAHTHSICLSLDPPPLSLYEFA